ncbi:MAG: hypothetical protein AAF542_20055, partial [Pseudomonadota bacterium]
CWEQVELRLGIEPTYCVINGGGLVNPFQFSHYSFALFPGHVVQQNDTNYFATVLENTKIVATQ